MLRVRLCEWMSTSERTPLPAVGVCDGRSMTADKQQLLYQTGCYEKISEILQANSKAIFWAVVATLIVLVRLVFWVRMALKSRLSHRYWN